MESSNGTKLFQSHSQENSAGPTAARMAKTVSQLTSKSKSAEKKQNKVKHILSSGFNIIFCVIWFYSIYLLMCFHFFVCVGC